MPSLFPPYDRRGQVGFHHLPARAASVLDLGNVRASNQTCRGAFSNE
jgi:hypothetical protein